MNDIDLLENLLETANKISFANHDEFDVLNKRTEMIVRKLFGDGSHYLIDLKSIHYSPMIIFGTGDAEWKVPFESGLEEFKNLLQVMIEDRKLSSNYDSKNAMTFIESDLSSKASKKTLKEIRVLIASPSDVIIERELLLNRLETSYRRGHFEESSNARIIADGWEYIPSQTGYPQDIVNSDLVKNANIILAVFRHKLGSPTIDLKTGKDRSQSGTAEELLYAIRNKTIKNPPLGMAYFYSNAPSISLESIDFERTKNEWDRLKKFKEEIKNEILYKTYNYEEEILDIACRDICENIIKYF